MAMKLIGLACGVLLAGGAAVSAEVKIDWDAEIGPVKPVNGVGQPPMLGGPTSFKLMHYLRDAGIPYARLHDVGGWQGQGLWVDIPNLFPDFAADEDDPTNYRFDMTDALLKALVANGVEPYFRLGVTIENFAGAGFAPRRAVPPEDFAKWARVCERVIRHYTEGWADGPKLKIAYWEIWNEPENHPEPKKNPMWQAPFDEYIRFYGVVAPYLKGKVPHLKIGGYGHCGFYAGVGSDHIPAANSSPRMGHFVECSHRFLKAAKENGWPLDFFSFHSYSEPKEALRQVRFADEHLNEYGFTRDKTERHFNEWLPYVSHDSLGTAKQAAGIAAELIGLQNGPCDLACIYDARCGLGNYSPLFNPMSYKPHKAYYAFKAFNELRTRGTAVKATADDPAVWVAAARNADGGAVMIANDSDRDVPLALDVGGLKPLSHRVTDAQWNGRYWNDAPTNLAARSFAVVFYDTRKATWARPQSTRRYLHGPFAERLIVQWREGKVTLGEVVHDPDWKKMPYEKQRSCGVWILHGANDEAFDFRAAKLRLEKDATPIAGESWRVGDLEYDLEGCAPFGRRPNAQMRLTVKNCGTSACEEPIAFLLRTAPEKDLCAGAPDGYFHYNPRTSDWLGLPPSWWQDGGNICGPGGSFVTFSEPVTIANVPGVARTTVKLAPGESHVIDFVLGKGKVEAPAFEATKARARADWQEELRRVEGRTELVRNLTVQMLQCFSVPTSGNGILPRQGGLQRWVWPGDQKQASAALDRLGYGEYVEKTVAYYFGTCQRADGEVGPFGNGWINDTASCLEVLSTHALVSGDRAFWTKWRDGAEKAFRWICALREQDGLFPAKKSTDSGAAFRHWGGTDLCNLTAIEKFADAAAKFGDLVAAEAKAVAADYRAAIDRHLDRWRRAYAGKDEFSIPFAPDGANEEVYRKGFYYSHPGNFAGAGFLSEEEMLRLRTWLLRNGFADKKGPCELCRSAREDIAEHVWYLTWSELGWFRGWLRHGRRDLAKEALDTCLQYAMTDEYLVGERYHDCDPWFFPWCPNASGSGRIVQMLLELEAKE